MIRVTEELRRSIELLMEMKLEKSQGSAKVLMLNRRKYLSL